MARLLGWLSLAMGVASIAIGAAHLVAGIASVPGEGSAGATVDSRERFYGAVFLGYGVAWVYAARQSPVRVVVVRWLAGIFLLGGLGRLLSLVVHGRPHWFQLVLTAVELGLPPLYMWLAGREGKTAEEGVRGSGTTTIV
ncbi:hypothetical protein GCM10010218_62720 [Streptomyces mashuensis]|uniref:DUF4345 domain-containing protein n=1 Tax=Streptomyces mashuensis TaxID=33904 RepID=A0A919BAR7_9ACTN|nr:DUF4345 domain-containing protein [Streptomyces mashuensis]GHF72976.1 hypothetical protein GCM10010218_62720 [Streptomyces mashuensis]